MASGEANAAVFQKTSSCNSSRSGKSLAPSKLACPFFSACRNRISRHDHRHQPDSNGNE